MGNLQEKLDWIRTSTNIDELNDFIQLAGPGSQEYEKAMAKRDALHFNANKEPHWTVVPSYRLLIFTAIVAAVALLVACWSLFLQWRADVRDRNKGSDSPPVESMSPSSRQAGQPLAPEQKQK